MSFNKSLLTLITEDLEKKKKPSKPRVPKNQWQHPGEVTTIPGNNITMDGVSYPVLGVPNVGPPQMMYPDQQYHFPDAGNVTEYPEMANGGYTVTRSSDRKGKTHKVTGPGGVVKYFGDSKLGQHPKDPERKAAFYARHKKNLDGNPFFRAFARTTWKDGGQTLGSGLLAKSVNCKSCGHSWKAVDGGEDPLTCHKCGQFNEQMQLGGLTRLASNAARFLQESTMLKNAYKLNPWAFKAHPEKYYRQLGKEGIDDAIKEGKILAKGQKDLLSRIPLDYVDEYTRAIDPSNASKLMVSKPATAPFFKKGQLFFPIERKATGVGYKGTKFSDAEYLAEGVLPDKAVLPRYQEKYFPSMEASGNVGVLTPEFNSLDNFTLYQRDWLRGYKPIKEDGGPVQPDDLETMYALGGEMIRRADGSYSKRGLWDNIRANRGSGNKPTSEMNAQKRRIAGQMQEGGQQDEAMRVAVMKGVDKTLAYGLKGAKWIGKNVFGTDDIVPDVVKDYMFNTVRPVSYPTDMRQVVAEFTRSDKAKPTRDIQGDLSMDEEAWSRVLRRPTKSKYFVPSKYKPTTATDPSAEYYTLSPDVFDGERMKRIIDDSYFNRNKKVNKAGQEYVPMQTMEPFMRKQFMKDYKKYSQMDFDQTDPLANFQIYRGVDPKTKKKYLSISDTYDFGMESANEVVKPMNIYDRFYYGNGGELDEYKNGGHGGLDRWFAEKWVDVKTGKTCGRQEGEKRKGYPACRPSKRVNSDTPKTSGELSGAEKAKFKREKTSSDRINYNHKKEDGGEVGWLDKYQDGGEASKYIQNVPQTFSRGVANTDETRVAASGLKLTQAQLNRNKAINKQVIANTEIANAKKLAERKKAIAESSDADIINPNGKRFAIGDKFRMFPNDIGGVGEMFDNFINPAVFVGNTASELGNAMIDRDAAGLATEAGLALGVGALGFDPLGKSINLARAAAPKIRTAGLATMLNKSNLNTQLAENLYANRILEEELIAPNSSFRGFTPDLPEGDLLNIKGDTYFRKDGRMYSPMEYGNKDTRSSLRFADVTDNFAPRPNELYPSKSKLASQKKYGISYANESMNSGFHKYDETINALDDNIIHNDLGKIKGDKTWWLKSEPYKGITNRSLFDKPFGRHLFAKQSALESFLGRPLDQHRELMGNVISEGYLPSKGITITPTGEAALPGIKGLQSFNYNPITKSFGREIFVKKKNGGSQNNWLEKYN